MPESYTCMAKRIVMHDAWHSGSAVTIRLNYLVRLGTLTGKTSFERYYLNQPPSPLPPPPHHHHQLSSNSRWIPSPPLPSPPPYPTVRVFDDI